MYTDDARWMVKFEVDMEQVKRSVCFGLQIYNNLRGCGWHLLHGHPWVATSWMLPEMIKLKSHLEVQKVTTDMSHCGMASRRPVSEVLELSR